MKPARRVERVLRSSRRHSLRGNERRTTDGRRRSVHTVKDGVVWCSEAEGETVPLREIPGIDSFDGLDEFSIVHSGNLVIRGDPGLLLRHIRSVQKVQSSDVFIGEKDALRSERVGRSKIVDTRDVFDRHEGDGITHALLVFAHLSLLELP